MSSEFGDIYKSSSKKKEQDLKLTEFDEGLTKPDAEDNNEIGSLEAAAAGVVSGLIKVPEGFVSLAAELYDLGADTNTAAKVEQYFDTINPFEEIAEQRAAGRLTEALVQIGVPGGVGAKLGLKLANKAIKAKKSGRYVNLKSKNLKKGLDKTKQLNQLSGKQKFAAITLGGATGEVAVADVERLGTFGDVFEAGPTELDRNVDADPQADAQRKLLNRLKFGSESLLITPIVYGAGSSIKALATRGKQLAYSNKKIDKVIDRIGSFFRPRGAKPQEVFLSKARETGRLMADTNFAREQVRRIDQEVDKMFPSVKTFLNKTTDDERGKFLKELNELLFSGDLKEGIPNDGYNAFLKSAKKKGADNKSIKNMINSVAKVRDEFSRLIDITAETPAGIQQIKKIQTDLRSLMGDRVQQYIGTTYRIFQNQDYGFYTRYKPTDESVNKVKDIFKRYAAKNKNPITDEEAEMLVNDILRQAKQYNPKTKLPTFEYENLTLGADTPTNVKTFATTLEKELPDGTKEIKVIGKGSKAFRELFGEIDDARYSIFEGMNRLGQIARKNQLFDEILDVDDAMKAKAKADTLPGQRGFFFESPMAARRALPNNEIVKIDDYVSEYFKDGVLINRLQGMYTSRDIAEAFGNSAKVSQFMRGESGGAIGKTASWAWRNLFLTPKAGSQYAKTVLSLPTHFRNFFSSGAFSIANGTIGENPAVMASAMNKARRLVQVGLRDPKAMEEYRELLELGIVNSNVRMGDLKNLMRDAKIGESGNIATDSVLKPLINSLGKIGEKTVRTARKAGQFAQDAYVAEDDFWKIFNYEVELARRTAAYNKAGVKKPVKEIKEEAADIVRNTIPNYAYVGEFVRAMRVTPFGNFMSWPSEIFRTGFGIFSKALDDIRDPVTKKINPVTSTNPLKGIGMKRLIGGVTAFGVLPYGLIKGVQAINGVSDEEADAGRDFVAPWSKNSQIMWFKDPQTGELYYSDWSSNNVYDTLTRPFQTVVRNIQEGIEDEEVLLKGFIEGITQAAAETANPFIGESIFTEAVADIFARGGRTKEGNQLYTEETPNNEKYYRILKHIAETQAPQYKQYVRVYDSVTGKPDNNGDVVEIDKALAGVFGFRMIKLRPDKGLEYYITDYSKGERNSRREFTGGPEGVLKPAKTSREVIERYFVANKALFDVHKKMKTHVRNAEKLGLNKKEISTIFDKRGAKKDLAYLQKELFDPYFPSKGVQDKFYEIARDTGLPNPFQEALPELKAMYKAFTRQRLDEDFEFKLEDFLPKPAEIGSQSALPQTPMPDPNIVNPQPQQLATATGLTPTEMSLLSPEEQQIRLRQRGLA